MKYIARFFLFAASLSLCFSQVLINPFLVSPSGGTSYTLKDSFTGTTSGSYSPGQSGLNANAYAVEFTAGSTYTITRVDVPLAKVGSPTQTYTCEIFTQSGTLPGVIVGTASAALDSSTFPSTETDVSFYPNATVTSGTKYYIVIRASALDASNYIAWYRVTTSGRVDVFNAASPAWTNTTTTRRLKFKTYSTP